MQHLINYDSEQYLQVMAKRNRTTYKNLKALKWKLSNVHKVKAS